MPAGVGGFISFHFAACRKISQFVRIISHRAKRDISHISPGEIAPAREVPAGVGGTNFTYNNPHAAG